MARLYAYCSVSGPRVPRKNTATNTEKRPRAKPRITLNSCVGTHYVSHDSKN